MRGAKALGIAVLCVVGAGMLVTPTPLVPGGPVIAATGSADAQVVVRFAATAAGPTDSPSPSALSTPTPTPTPTDTGAAPAPTTATAEPTASVSPTPAQTALLPAIVPTPSRSAPSVPPVSPAITAAAISYPTLIIAIGVLVAAGLFIWSLLRRRSNIAPGPRPAEAPIATIPAPVVLDSMAAMGTAMIDSGYPVGLVHEALRDLATASGRPTVQAIVFPTSILVSSTDSAVAQTRAVSAGDNSYLLHQVDRVDRIVGVACS